MIKKRRLQIGVIGSAGNEEYPNLNQKRSLLFKKAETIGFNLAKKGAIVITGGKGGIMEAVEKGTKKAGGITVGFVSGKKRFTSNRYTDFEVVSGMEGCGEETMLILSCDGLIALGGGAGTLQELTIAYRNKKPVVILDSGYGWADKVKNSYLDERKIIKFRSASEPENVVSLLLKLIK